MLHIPVGIMTSGKSRYVIESIIRSKYEPNEIYGLIFDYDLDNVARKPFTYELCSIGMLDASRHYMKEIQGKKVRIDGNAGCLGSIVDNILDFLAELKEEKLLIFIQDFLIACALCQSHGQTTEECETHCKRLLDSLLATLERPEARQWLVVMPQNPVYFRTYLTPMMNVIFAGNYDKHPLCQLRAFDSRCSLPGCSNEGFPLLSIDMPAGNFLHRVKEDFKCLCLAHSAGRIPEANIDRDLLADQLGQYCASGDCSHYGELQIRDARPLASSLYVDCPPELALAGRKSILCYMAHLAAYKNMSLVAVDDRLSSLQQTLGVESADPIEIPRALTNCTPFTKRACHVCTNLLASGAFARAAQVSGYLVI